MAMFANVINHIFAKYFKREEVEQNQISKIESYLSIVYKVLIWEDPFLSGIAFFLTHVLFWIVIHFELRLYGLIFMSLIVLFSFDAIFENIVSQTNRSLPLKNIRETIKFCSAFLHYLSSLRREYPGMFCISMCTVFLFLSLIGQTLSGLFLSYSALVSFILLPGIIYRLPPEFLNSVRHTLNIISTDEGIVEEAELIPTHQDDLEDKDADSDSLKTNNTADSFTHSFLSGITAMPSYLDAEGSLDGLDEDLDFTIRSIPIVPNDSNSSSDSEIDHKDVKFESLHFNRDSSSEEEHKYEQGLTFSELDVTDESKTIITSQQMNIGNLSNLGNVGNSLINTVLKITAGSSPQSTKILNVPKRNDSDSDFEIIDAVDLPNDET